MSVVRQAVIQSRSLSKCCLCLPWECHCAGRAKQHDLLHFHFECGAQYMCLPLSSYWHLLCTHNAEPRVCGMTKHSIRRNGAWKEEGKKKKKKNLIQGECARGTDGWAWNEGLKIKNFNCYCFWINFHLPPPRCCPIPAPGWWRSSTRAAGSWGHRSLRRTIKLTMLGTLRPILRDWDKTHTSAL